MEKWKTQEAAFPTFPQGLPRGTEKRTKKQERRGKDSKRRSHERIIPRRACGPKPSQWRGDF